MRLSIAAMTASSWRVKKQPVLVRTVLGIDCPESLSTTVDASINGVALAIKWSHSWGERKPRSAKARGAHEIGSTAPRHSSTPASP